MGNYSRSGYLINTLKERIEVELRDIERAVQRAEGAWEGATRLPEQRDYYFDSLALNLHSFYNGLERIFQVIARQLDPVFHRVNVGIAIY